MENSIIFYDGECILCSRFLKILLKIDKKRTFRYSLIGSKTFKEITIYQSQTLPDSVIFYSQGKIKTKSDAIFSIIQSLGGWWKVLNIFRIFPEKLLDFLYDNCASRRYGIFGKSNKCYLPTTDEKDLFLP